MGLSSLCTLQSQGHLGKRRDTDAVSEEDTGRGVEREGERRKISDGKRVGNVKYFLVSTS